MILYLLVSVCVIVITVIVVIEYKKDKRDRDTKLKDFNTQCAILLNGVLWLIYLIMSLIILLNHTNYVNRIEYEKTKQEIESLESSKNVIELLENNESKKIAIIEYNDKVKDFNIKIIEKKENLNNLWINWFTANYYKDIELIDYIR